MLALSFSGALPVYLLFGLNGKFQRVWWLCYGQLSGADVSLRHGSLCDQGVNSAVADNISAAGFPHGPAASASTPLVHTSLTPTVAGR